MLRFALADEWMASELPNGQYLFCPDGSHQAHYDDQEVSMEGLIRCVLEVDETARIASSQPGRAPRRVCACG